VPAEVVEYDDGIAGRVRQDLAREVGDFVVRRGDGVFAYQLAVVVDDAESRVTDVVRGADLVASTPRQIWLARVLGLDAPRYLHVPLVLAEDGTRLEKRGRGASVRELREKGVSAERILGELAHGLGITATNEPRSARDVAGGRTPSGHAADVVEARRGADPAWRREAWRIPAFDS
jgi:glutamyl-tRNA synthetase